MVDHAHKSLSFNRYRFITPTPLHLHPSLPQQRGGTLRRCSLTHRANEEPMARVTCLLSDDAIQQVTLVAARLGGTRACCDGRGRTAPSRLHARPALMQRRCSLRRTAAFVLLLLAVGFHSNASASNDGTTARRPGEHPAAAPTAAADSGAGVRSRQLQQQQQQEEPAAAAGLHRGRSSSASASNLTAGLEVLAVPLSSSGLTEQDLEPLLRWGWAQGPVQVFIEVLVGCTARFIMVLKLHGAQHSMAVSSGYLGSPTPRRGQIRGGGAHDTHETPPHRCAVLHTSQAGSDIPTPAPPRFRHCAVLPGTTWMLTWPTGRSRARWTRPSCRSGGALS